MIDVKIQNDEHADLVEAGGEALYSLCQKEAESFSEYLKSHSGSAEQEWMYQDGLTDWEKTAVASYLYQKLKGRLRWPDAR